MVAVAGAGVAGNFTGVDLGGGRSSGEVELVVCRHGEGRAGVLRAPASAWKMKACSVAFQRGCGHESACGGGGKLRLQWQRGLEDVDERGERGKRWWISQWLQGSER